MKKRILSLVLCAAMLLSMCLFLGAGVAEDTTADGSAESTETVDGVNIVSFTNAGPLVTPEQNVGPAKVRALAANGTGSGVQLDKTVTKDENSDTYTVRLEAYATGAQTTVVSTKPCDIVLVLDVSGSMDGYLKETVYNQVSPYWNSNSNNYDGKDNWFVRLEDGTYAKVTIERSGSNRERTYTYTYTDENGTVHTETSSGSDNKFTAWPLYYAEQRDSSVKKLDALKSAVNTFIEEVAKKETATVKHNISIVKFAGDSINTVGNDTYDRRGYNYSQIVMNLMDAKDNQKALKDAVNELNAGGATSADYGMEHAQTVLEKAQKDASKVVVMFTDGEPNHNNGFDRDVADSTISAAKTLKDKGATVYTVGCMDVADATRVTDWNGVKDVNKYMHLVSSNYKDATEMSKPGDATYPEDTSKSYYLTAKNADDLKNVFESISQQLGGSDTKLTDTAVLKDAVTPYFEIPDGAQVTLKTAKCTGVDESGKLAFDTKTETNAPPDVKATVSDNIVSVTGFDYKAHWCGNHSGIYDGQKLIVEFTIRPTNDFLGGNGVKTNVGTEDGIYAPDKPTPVEKFQPQHVDVPVKAVNPEATDYEIYLGETTNLQDRVNTVIPRLNHENNAYVNVTYTVEDEKGTAIGTYTVPAGNSSGTWVWSEAASDGTVAPEQTTTYTVTSTSTPANPVGTQKAVSSDPVEFKITVNTCSLTITKTVKGEGANPNQTFVFDVEDSTGKVVTTIVLKNNESKTITGLAVGDYTVVEDTNWSWSYSIVGNNNKTATLSSEESSATVPVTNNYKSHNWLTSIADVINKWVSTTKIQQIPDPKTN